MGSCNFVILGECSAYWNYCQWVFAQEPGHFESKNSHNDFRLAGNYWRYLMISTFNLGVESVEKPICRCQDSIGSVGRARRRQESSTLYGYMFGTHSAEEQRGLYLYNFLSPIRVILVFRWMENPSSTRNFMQVCSKSCPRRWPKKRLCIWKRDAEKTQMVVPMKPVSASIPLILFIELVVVLQLW
jgi:hypothetical protein